MAIKMEAKMAEPNAVVEPTVLSEVEEAAKEIVRPLSELTESELLAEIERRRELKEEKVEQVVTPPLGSAPPGFIWVYNRISSPFSWQKDSVTYIIAAHSFGIFPDDTAQHGRKRSILLLDPILQKAVYALALEGDAMYAKPLKMRKRLELLDRTTQDNLTPYSAVQGGKTHAVPFELNEVKAMLSRRLDAFVELE